MSSPDNFTRVSASKEAIKRLSKLPRVWGNFDNIIETRLGAVDQTGNHPKRQSFKRKDYSRRKIPSESFCTSLVSLFEISGVTLIG